MCIYYERNEKIEQANSTFPLVTFEHKCSKVYINELNQNVEIISCPHFELFENCDYFERIINIL